jgi:hypothetical protein
MTKSIARVAVAGLLALAASGASAQGFSTYKPQQSMYMFNYEFSAPLGSFESNYISDWSWAGMSFEGRTMIKPKISAGVGFTYNRFDQTYTGLTQERPPGGAISGSLFRYNDQFAIKMLLHYYLRDAGVRPYAGVGIGGVWSFGYTQMADLAVSENDFDFIVSPELGLTFEAGGGASKFGFNAAVRYNYTTVSFGRVNDLQSLGFVVGIYGAY